MHHLAGNSAFSPKSDEPAVRSAALAVFVEAAKALPVHEPTVTFEAIREQVDARLLKRRAGVALGVVGTAAAILLTLNLVGPTTDRAGAPMEGVAGVDDAVAASALEVDRSMEAEVEDDSTPPQLLALASDIRIASHGDFPEATVLGERAAQIGRGVYTLTVDDEATAPLRLTFGAEVGEVRVLSLAHGELEVDSTGKAVVTRLMTGVAAWEGRNGEQLQIELSSEVFERAEAEEGEAEGETEGETGADAKASAARKTPTAEALATRAESELSAGDRRAAIKTLRTLVQTHRRSPQARTGLLDLAGLLKASGDVHGSRCAYELYLQRWPAGALSTDVERSLDKLGEGPDCRGLRPQGD